MATAPCARLGLVVALQTVLLCAQALVESGDVDGLGQKPFDPAAAAADISRSLRGRGRYADNTTVQSGAYSFFPRRLREAQVA